MATIPQMDMSAQESTRDALAVKRRAFITLIGRGAVWPLAARAQQRPIPVIGLLHGGAANTFVLQLAAFHMGLNEGGFVEGQTLTIEYRWAEEHPERFP